MGLNGLWGSGRPDDGPERHPDAVNDLSVGEQAIVVDDSNTDTGVPAVPVLDLQPIRDVKAVCDQRMRHFGGGVSEAYRAVGSLIETAIEQIEREHEERYR